MIPLKQKIHRYLKPCERNKVPSASQKGNGPGSRQAQSTPRREPRQRSSEEQTHEDLAGMCSDICWHCQGSARCPQPLPSRKAEEEAASACPQPHVSARASEQKEQLRAAGGGEGAGEMQAQRCTSGHRLHKSTHCLMKQALKMPEQLLQLRPVSVRQTHPSCKIQRPQTFHRVFFVFFAVTVPTSPAPKATSVPANSPAPGHGPRVCPAGCNHRPWHFPSDHSQEQFGSQHRPRALSTGKF